jgi:hypothetical protein
MQTLSNTPTISIRASTPADARTVMRLAALDSAPVPFGPVLIAEIDGEPKAALALRDGRVVADPFARTAELVQLLQMHASLVEQAEEERTATRSPGLARRFGLAA